MCIFAAAAAPAAASAASSGAAASAAAMTATQAFIANAAVAASIAAAVATPIVSYTAQASAANAQSAYQEKMYAANKGIAEQSMLSQYTDIARRQQEEQKKAAQEMSIISRQADQARATARTSAIESGVAGLSIDSLMDDYYRKESEFLVNTQDQLRGTLFQLERSKEAVRAETQGRVLGMTPQPVAGPSAVGMGLQLAGNAAGLYSDVYLNNFDRSVLRASLGIK